MPSPDLSVALASPFTFTENPTLDLSVTFPSGASPAEATVPTGTYRIHLAPTSGSVKDLLRTLQTEINTAIAALARAETVSVTMTARGRVQIAVSAGTVSWTLSSDLAAVLGFTATSYSAVASITSTHLPRHFYAFVGGETRGPMEETEVAARATTAGSVIGIQSGVKRWREELTLMFIPRNPSLAAAADEPADWSAWEPNHGGGTSAPWTLAELRREALGKECAVTQNWPAVRGSTSEAYDLAYLDPDAIARPRGEQQFPSLAVWMQWTLPLLYPCDATNTWLRKTATRA